MHRKAIICSGVVLILSMAPIPGLADVVDIVNSIRSQGCAELPPIDRPLMERGQLEEAARRIARGDTLEAATSGSGYRARKSTSIKIRTENGDDSVAQILTQHFCETVADSSLHEIGAFRRGDEIWIVLAAPLSPPASEDSVTASRRVLELVNEARLREHRCGRETFPAARPLRRAAALEHAARVHAEDMAANNFLGHKGSNQSKPAERVTRAGYGWASVAENVAAGQTTAAQVVSRWLASPGHCANLMNPRYAESGVARATNPESEKGIYWVQVFAAPKPDLRD